MSEARCSSDNRYFLNAIRKYGASNFKLEQIDTTSSIEELKQKEINYIKLYNSTNREIGYNISLGGDGTPGVLKSKETREKMRIKALGRKRSKESILRQKLTVSKLDIDFSKGIENCKKHNLKTSKPILKLDLNKNIIKEYSSISETYKNEKIDRIGLIRYLKSNKFQEGISYKGFLYKTK